MAKKKTEEAIKIPFDNSGVQSYPWEYATGFRWKKNYEFEDTMELAGMYRGRSAAGFEMIGSDGKRYPMFLKDGIAMILGNVVDHGKIHGTWTFQKRGRNYGVRLVVAK